MTNKFEIKTDNGTYDVEVYRNGELFKPLADINPESPNYGTRPFIRPRFKGKKFVKVLKRNYDIDKEAAGRLMDSKWRVGNNPEYDEIFTHLRDNGLV